MLHRTRCEVLRKYSTAIRLAVAMELVRRHGKSQLEASRLAGVKQPLLNYVLNGRRRLPLLEELYSDERALAAIQRAADLIAMGKDVSMCYFCGVLGLGERVVIP